MIDTLKKIFGFSEPIDFARLAREGAMILDVRSKGEYAGGHIKGSVNIPVDQLGQSLKRLPGKDKAIITCCASGMRSATARTLLKSNGYHQVFNGGSWFSLKNKL
ncbi:MAG TPA: rhodanese-like domain-containing protein [Cyclobacteriaceae bacterium]|nr:rhodanese-like domain-containing protein [Cyclobacteriaceae bacterium]